MRGNRDFQFTSNGNSRSKIARPAGVLVRSQGKKAKTRCSYHSESGSFFGVVKATEIRRSKETDWSFAQFVGFSERVQIMQDRTRSLVDCVAGVFWFFVPILVLRNNPSVIGWKLGEGLGIGLVRLCCWPFSAICFYSFVISFVSTKKRHEIKFPLFMHLIPFALCAAIVMLPFLLWIVIAVIFFIWAGLQ